MKTAMILAAGRGERLKPLTEKIPKALCLVQGKPLIEHHVLNLAKAGFERIVINHAYLGGKIRQYLGNGSRYGVEICYSPETPGGLETGGGIVKALPLLGKDSFVTVNGDIYTDFDFSSIDPAHNEFLTMILVKNNPGLLHHGDFGLSPNHTLTNTNLDYTFAGIACYQPEIFSGCQQGRYSVTPLIRQLVAENKVLGRLHSGFWFDIGSQERLEAANCV
ncbi:MAG: nucleotidyltransferase family protein [Legionella sp.]|nr:MAG: nucleotidyltransferase family protein [Legionella sp.]